MYKPTKGSLYFIRDALANAATALFEDDDAVEVLEQALAELDQLQEWLATEHGLLELRED